MAAKATTLSVNPASRRAPIWPASVDVAVPAHPRRLRFGSFELNPRSGELTGGDGTVVLQWQPLRLLMMLVECGGEMVTRDEIQKRLWDDDVIVDFEHSINQLVRKLRRVLGDSAEAPNYIETIARRGYRLKPPVEVLEKANAHSAGAGIPCFAAGKLPAARKGFVDGEPAASDQSSSLRLRVIAGAGEHRDVAALAVRCRRHSSFNLQERRDNLAPLVRRLAMQPLRDCLSSAPSAERLDALRQLLVLVTQVLEGC